MPQQQRADRRNPHRGLTLVAALAAGLPAALPAAATLAALAPAGARAEMALPPAKNPPGDIPDNQVFIHYSDQGVYSLKIPEGWSRAGKADAVRFSAKFDAVGVTLSKAPAQAGLSWVKSSYVPQMKKDLRAPQIIGVHERKLPAGTAYEIVYRANSDPNPVTNKRVRLEGNRYLFIHGGRLAALDLTAPQGADNVDQWRAISRSFRWQ